MKRALCIMIGLVLISSVVYSKEISPGTISLSGTTGLGFFKTTTSYEGMDDLDSDLFTAEINGEYYIIPNLGVGLILMYESGSQDYAYYDGSGMSIDTMDYSSVMVGPQVVYNVNLNEQMSAPIFAGFGHVSYDDDGDKMSGWAWVVGGGLRYFVMDRISFDGYIYYDSMSLEDDVTVDITDISGRAGISIYLGGE
jgi:hypothetical protein